VEHYFRERAATMRFQSWSMAKSVTSLLLGICIDRGLIQGC
jgi:CubicO group peptidase (beta-lactamase class C family)